ncbi:DUF4013 domain-containing protein [Halocatena halophila]|uniref:DUF4013 domain-containing protein n=1 Tax=Halocatena halophila TaxID=2814576 RepID=UPI002ED6A48E
MIVDALKYPFRGDDRARTFGIGSALMILTVLLVQVGRSLPSAIFLLAFVVILTLLATVFGYLVRCMSQAQGATCDPPAFAQPKRLLIQGASAIAIALAYFLVPFVLILLEVVLSGGAVTGLTVGMTLLTYLLLLIEIFLLPVAVTNYAITDDIRAAFDFKTIASGVATGTYVVSFLIAFVCTILMQIMEFVRGVIHINFGGMGVLFLVFTLITTPIAFYLYMVNARVLSRGCANALSPSNPEEPSDETPAGDGVAGN